MGHEDLAPATQLELFYKAGFLVFGRGRCCEANTDATSCLLGSTCSCGGGRRGQAKAVVAVGIGAVKAKFTLDVTRPEMKEPELMIVKAHGKAPGSAVDLLGDMQLIALDEGQTQMDWKANVNVSGTIASVGARLLNGVAQKLTGQFFDCLKTRLQTPATSSTE